MPDDVRDLVFARVLALRDVAPLAAEDVALAMLAGTALGLRAITASAPTEVTRRMVEALGLDVAELVATLVN